MNLNLQTVELLAGLGLFLALVFSANTIQKIIQIRRTHTTWISALPAAGRVEVQGKAGPPTIRAPISSLPCVFWQLEIQELNGTPKNGSYWATIDHKNSLEPFEISDGTGKVQIQPEGADLSLRDDLWKETLNQDMKVKLRALGIETKNESSGVVRKLGVHERRIVPGDAVFITGEVQQVGDGKVIAYGAAPLVISEKDEANLLGDLYTKLEMNFFLAALIVMMVVILLALKH